ncbi:Domain of uncharacterised function (DUF2825) [Salmonella enterica subsp. enterica]|uniref:Domain of uncharacterized function (DUF2825) n=1 Tax=Salmonella enterica I TaxID=59201 RepID=A0A447N4P5_SALET|nr:Domain of uncharacterised function (DUF2825) [Salmonella enterica subsp. enterica]
MAVLLRFIPAGAGNTRVWKHYQKRSTVYPRWRGEHRQNCTSRPCPYGLSPLARGTPSPEFCPATTTRFIPAGAGNTIDTSTGWPFFTVYPRWRGEHWRCKFLRFSYLGLSPAGAGNTRLFTLIMLLFSVYPRWRGEHVVAVVFSRKHDGLSPLARGTHGLI